MPMQSIDLKINHLLGKLEEEDYDKVVSYIEYLVDARRKAQIQKERETENKEDIESIVASLVGAIPDTGKTLEEYRNERLKKYEDSH